MPQRYPGLGPGVTVTLYVHSTRGPVLDGGDRHPRLYLRSTVRSKVRSRVEAKPSTSASATARGSVGAPSSPRVTVASRSCSLGSPRRRRAGIGAARSRRTGGARAGSIRAGGRLRHAAPGRSRRACARRPVRSAPCWPAKQHRSGGTVVAGDGGVDAEAGQPGDEAACEELVDGIDASRGRRPGGAGRRRR